MTGVALAFSYYSKQRGAHAGMINHLGEFQSIYPQLMPSHLSPWDYKHGALGFNQLGTTTITLKYVSGSDNMYVGKNPFYFKMTSHLEV